MNAQVKIEKQFKKAVPNGRAQVAHFISVLDILLYACHATQAFTVDDIHQNVSNKSRRTVYLTMISLVAEGLLERVPNSVHYYLPTEFAKDLLNTPGEIVK